MYSPFHQLKKPVNQQNTLENVSQFPAHLVPGTLELLLIMTDIYRIEAQFELPLDHRL